MQFLFSNQSQCESKAIEVFNNIIMSIGNSYPPPPDLKIIDSKRSVAYSDGVDIVIEEKIISSLCGTANFEDKLSYIISHELAHHYLNHTWMFNTGFAYSSPLGEFINESNSYNQRKLSEIQADLFGGFFGQISGYKTLSSAEEVMNHVYQTYNLSDNIKGYPSLGERILIIENNIEKVETLELLFDLGNILLKLGKYDYASKAFEDILNDRFNSREIYNNLGLCYLLQLISISDGISNYKFPVSLDLETRASVRNTRSINRDDDANSLINKASRQFNTSINLDPDYKPAYRNLLVLNFIQSLRNGNNNALDEINNSNIDIKIKNDFIIINHLKNNRINEAKSLFSKGTEVSYENLSEDKTSYSNDYNGLLNELKLDIGDFIFNNFKFKKYRAERGELNIGKHILPDISIYKLDNYFIISTSLELKNEKNYEVISYNGLNTFVFKTR